MMRGIDRRGLARQTHRRMRSDAARVLRSVRAGSVDAAEATFARKRDVSDPWGWD